MHIFCIHKDYYFANIALSHFHHSFFSQICLWWGTKNLFLISSHFSRVFHILHLPHFTYLLFLWWKYRLLPPSHHHKDHGSEHFNIFPLVKLYTSDFGVHAWGWDWILAYLILLAIALLLFRMAAPGYTPNKTVLICPHLFNKTWHIWLCDICHLIKSYAIVLFYFTLFI